MVAIYARQSIDKIDSISIETQIDFCKKRVEKCEDFKIFIDKGYSGGNTNRPQFQEMLNLCEEKVVNKIITYKLDRISRSLLDFVLLLEELEKDDVELISCTENFSSKSEMGVLIMKLLIMFAEMERKNIRNRIRDNYYARGEKGFYLGGYASFGYRKTSIKINGKKTSGYEIENREADIVNRIYRRYVFDDWSANKICKELNKENVFTKRGGMWSPISLLRLIRNPFYVKADWKIYEFFISEKAIITTNYDDIVNNYGCVCYGNKEKRNGVKFKTFEGEHITIGGHLGIVDSEIWLKAMEKSRNHNALSVQKNGQTTLLCGLVKCGFCGSNYTVTKAKNYTYLYCRQRKSDGCKTLVKSIRADFLEEIVIDVINSTLLSFSVLKRKATETKEEIQAKIELSKLKVKAKLIENEIMKCAEEEIGLLLSTTKEISQKIFELEKKISNYKLNQDEEYIYLREIPLNFSNFLVDLKRIFVINLINKIIIYDGKIHIFLMI